MRRFPGIVAPDSIDLGLAWVGHEATAALFLLNTGAAEGCAEVEAELDVRPRNVCLQPGESVEVEVLWLPRQAGPIASRLHIERTGGNPLDVEVLGLAREPPECMPADVCHVANFDPDAGTCMGTELADGSACDAGLCMRGGTCLAGTCLGQFACDDGDPCSADVCGPNGCTTLGPASACPEAPSTCLVPICLEGECDYAPAPDGIECAPSDCAQRFFCSAGACLPQDTETEGATCVGQCGEGICLGGSCSEGFPATSELLFHYEPNADSTFRSRSGNGPSLVLDSEGRAFWLEEQNKQQFVLVGATTDGVFIRQAIDGDPRSGWPPQLLATFGVVVVSTGGSVQAFRSTDGSPLWKHQPLSPDTFARCLPPAGGDNPRGVRLAATSDGRVVVAAWCSVPERDYFVPPHGIAVLRTKTGEVLLASEGEGILRALLVDASDRILVAGPVDTPPSWGESILPIPPTRRGWKEATAEGKVTTYRCEIIDLESGALVEMELPTIPCRPPALMSELAFLQYEGTVYAVSLHDGNLSWSVALEPADAEEPSSWGILLTSNESALVSHGHRPCATSRRACFIGNLSEIDLAGALLRSCALPNNLEFQPFGVRNEVVWGLARRFSLDWRVVALRLPRADESQHGWVTPWGGGSGAFRER